MDKATVLKMQLKQGHDNRVNMGKDNVMQLSGISGSSRIARDTKVAGSHVASKKVENAKDLATFSATLQELSIQKSTSY